MNDRQDQFLDALAQMAHKFKKSKTEIKKQVDEASKELADIIKK